MPSPPLARAFVTPLLCLLAVAFVSLPAEDARAADVGFSIGQDLSTFNVAGAEDLSNLNTRIGLRLGRFEPVVTFDFARLKTRTEFDSPDFDTRTLNLTLITLGGGLKYLFAPAEAGQVVPFTVGEAFTAIPILDNTTEVESVNFDAFWSVGFLAGGGAQYQVTDGFSIGAELGFNGFFAGVDRQAKKTSLSILQFYTAAHLSFFF